MAQNYPGETKFFWILVRVAKEPGVVTGGKNIHANVFFEGDA